MIAAKLSAALKNQVDQTRAPSKNITFSWLGACRRMMAYKRLGFPALPEDTERRAVMNDGDVHHEAIRKQLLDAGLNLTDVEKEVLVEIVPGFPVKGRIDGIVEIDGVKLLLEIKSASQNSYWEMIKNGLTWRYMAQVQALLKATDLTTANVLLKNKNSGELADIIVYRDPAILANLQERLSQAYNATPENLPERDNKPDEDGVYVWECVGCLWRHHCTGSTELKHPGKNKKK